ncbi:MAG: type II secretion system protein GspE, partial [Luteimonas sp.]
FYGRLPVYDIMVVDEALANGIADDAGREGLRNLAMNAGFRGIEEVARARILAGQTTSEEVLRVVGVGPAP